MATIGRYSETIGRAATSPTTRLIADDEADGDEQPRRGSPSGDEERPRTAWRPT